MAVEILTCAVVAHRGTGISMAGGDLRVSQRHSGIEHGGHMGVASAALAVCGRVRVAIRLGG